MTCRIDRVVTGEDVVVLRISGRIAVPDLEVVRDLLQQEHGALALDLKELLFIDRDAVKLLALTEADGVQLRNCPPYIREWIARERAQSNAGSSDDKAAKEDNDDVDSNR